MVKGTVMGGFSRLDKQNKIRQERKATTSSRNASLPCVHLSELKLANNTLLKTPQTPKLST